MGFEGEAMWVPAREHRPCACAPSAYPGAVPAHPTSTSGIQGALELPGHPEPTAHLYQVAAENPESTGALHNSEEKEAETKRGRF